MKNIIIDADTGVDDSLAKAYLKDKTLPKKLKRVVSMGGCIDVPGNINNYAEANIHGDAKAADIVMGAGFCMTLVGLDVTMKTFITDRDVKNLCEYASEECRPIARMMGKRAGVGMTGHKGLFRIMKYIPDPGIIQMGNVDDHADPLHLLHKGNSGLCQAMFRIRHGSGR